MSVITRFAPSPTGYLHIGGARTALFNYLFAKHHNGKFLLRIEDTDKERSSKEAIDAILQGLNWLGLNHDDEYVLQSRNAARHKEVALELLQNGRAYLCYVSQQELEEMRKAAEKKGEVFRFKSPWRNKAMSQNSSVKPVIRIKAPLEGETVINDLVQGKIIVKNNELDDLVMLRSDESATYMLAVVIDDFDMNITHIIRGDDHLNNAFRQKVIYDAMNWKVPEFAHIPLIHGSDGAKMSKRHGATSVIDYKNLGYLPEGMRNYLLRLGWSCGDKEIISTKEAIELFSLEKVGKSPSRFDFAKLAYINKHYIKETSEEELIKLCEFNEVSDVEKVRLLRAIKFLKEKVSLISELKIAAEIYLNDVKKDISESDYKLAFDKKNLLSDLLIKLENLDDYFHEEIKNSLNEFSAKNNLKIKDFGPALRIALTFSSASGGGVFEIVEILGKIEVISRIKHLLNQLN